MMAATRLSANRADVARACLELISTYTPQYAAAQILDGCVRIVRKEESDRR
jgi:hypothetical protein